MTEIPKVYDPKAVESRWYQQWLDGGYFQASLEPQRRPYCIVIPPPNITGSLHLGHALNNTLQDILVRWKRMEGYNVLWVPGTDHAGIATQNVVERQLKAEGKTRETLGRKEFIRRVWQWREQSGRTIIEQLKRLGASCDWSRERFTLDEGLSSAVREVFVRLYNEGLIYRGERLINWCPRCQTALSDIEVEHEEVDGKMYYIKYPLATPKKGEPEHLTVATTRPETMLGDTAVAVHPEDPRYNQLIGHQVQLPLTRRRIPIVGDPILVDREFGTGAVKITPGHDFNDEKAGQRHKLQIISLFYQSDDSPVMIMDDLALSQDAKVKPELLKELVLKPVPEARELIVQWLEQENHLIKIEKHRHAVGKCYRCKTVVEPFLSPQWFVKVNDPAPKKSLVAKAIEVVRKDYIQFIPESWKNNYFGWMENIQDWCISRQIWWGHQIPAWYCKKCNVGKLPAIEYSRALPQKPLTGQAGEVEIPEDQKQTWQWVSPDAKPIVLREKPARCPQCGGAEFVQDPDVLDTWFSSALWPFSTLGWPAELQPNIEKRKEAEQTLKIFYPTSTLVTSFDILFFWVARMIMMGLYCKPKPTEGKSEEEANNYTENIPFRNVYIHALVRDAEGQKMSKSKGNVIDPLGVMEKYGTDALRFTLAAMASPGRDIKLSEQRIEGYRNFANKIWNAARFVLMNLEGRSLDKKIGDPTLADRWIRVCLRDCVVSVTKSLETYRFDEAAKHLYQFIWHEYCDWYLELIKPRLLAESPNMNAAATRITMVTTLETLLRLLHPFMPFITEEIWQKLPHAGETIVLASYPQAGSISAEEERIKNKLEQVIDIIKKIRTFRSDFDIAPVQQIKAALITWDDMVQLIKHHRLNDDISRLARVVDFDVETSINGKNFPPSSPVLRTDAGEVWIDPRSLGIFDPQKRKVRLEKKLSSLEADLSILQEKISDKEFMGKAPPEVIAKNEARVIELVEEKFKLTNQLSLITGLMEEHPS